MSASVRYGFITSSRSRAPSICSRIACEAATNPPGITCARAIGVEPASAGSGSTPKSRWEAGRRVRGSWSGKLLVPAGRRHSDPHHHVVAAVLEVIFDSGTTRPRDGAVDHVQLAVVSATHLVLPPVDVLVVRIEASRSRGNTSLTTICAPEAASCVNISRASPCGLEP